MDALLIVPAAVASFGGAYYLGKACLMLVVGSLHQAGSGRSAGTTAQVKEAPARPLRSAKTLAS